MARLSRRASKYGMPNVLYLSMEVLHHGMEEPHRSANLRGGLGALAGDTIYEAAALGLPIVGFTSLYARPWYGQIANDLSYEDFGPAVWTGDIPIAGKSYHTTVRELLPNHLYGIECPQVNTTLYTDDRENRFLEEVLFAHATAASLPAINFAPEIVWHNESHTAPAFPLLNDHYSVKTLFTIHTPVEAGMERFFGDRFEDMGIDERYRSVFVSGGGEVLDFTAALMSCSNCVNAVSQEHEETTEKMFPPYRSKISSVTNGVSRRWMYPRLRQWVEERGYSIPVATLLAIQEDARRDGIAQIARLAHVQLDSEQPMVGFTRRMAKYKNIIPMLEPIASAVCAPRGMTVLTEFGELPGLGMQVVIAGHAVESDSEMLDWMNRLSNLAALLPGRFVYIPEYTYELLQFAAWSLDALMEIPLAILEACGTSGMRIFRNGKTNIATRTGGMREYVEEFNPASGKGTGFFVEPYTPLGLFEKLRQFSEIWYRWREHGDGPYPDLAGNVFRASSDLDVGRMILDGYVPIFEKLVS